LTGARNEIEIQDGTTVYTSCEKNEATTKLETIHVQIAYGNLNANNVIQQQWREAL